MAGKELKVIITAQDGASRVFSEVGSSAQAAGNSVERAGDQGSAGADKLTKSTAELSAEMNEAATAATLVGGAITAAFVAPMMAGATAAFRQVNAVEQATIALNAYETDARKVNRVLEELVAYAQSDLGRLFQREELFAAAQGLRVAGAETENLTRYVEIMGRSVSTGMATWNELDSVLGRIISTGRLTTVEFELLQQAGYQLDEELRNTTVTTEELFDALERGSVTVAGQTETIQGQITMTMSSLRGLGLELLGVNEKSQFVAGGLGDTLVGALSQTRDMIDALRPVAGAAGDALGLMASMASDAVYAFTSLPDWLQSTALGLTALSGAALTAVGGLALVVPRIIATVAAISSVAPAAIAAVAALGPIGWAVIGVTAALTAGAIAFGNHARAAEEARAIIETLSDAYYDLQVAAMEAGRQGDVEAEARLHQLRFQVESVRAESQAIYDEASSGAFVMKEMTEGYKMTGEQAESLAASQERLGAAFSDSSIDGAALSADMDALYWSFMRGEITMADYVFRMGELALNVEDYRIATDEAAASTHGLAAAFGLIQAEADGFLQTIMSLNEIGDDDSFVTKMLKALGTSEGDRAALGVVLSDIQDVYGMYDDMPAPDAEHAEWVAWVNEAEQGTMAWRYRVAAANQAMAEQSLILDDVNEQFDINNTLIGQQINRAREHATAKAAEGEAMQEHLELVRETSEAILELTGNASLLNQINMVGLGNDATMAAMGVNNAAAALETTFRVIVGNTNAIGSQVDAVEQWGEALIGVQGEYSKLDDLVKAGRITGTSGVYDDGSQYAQAQQAYNDILEDNAAIQEHILTIQAQQAPMIAQNVAALEDYMRQIADMNDGTEEGARRQMEALAWMDEGLQGQAAQTLGIVQNLQAMGADGEAAFRAMADSAAVTNPYLFSMYETMGLISNVVRDENGTVLSYDVHLDGADSVLGKIGELTESINSLVDALYLIYINGDNEDALDAIWTVETEVTDLDGKTATVSINLLDNATNGINAAMNALIALDGSSATTTIRTIYENRGIGPGVALGGVVQEYASGGVVIRAGEVGPEIAHFANGGTALIPRDGIYSVPAGSYITPNHAVGNSYGGIDLGGIHIHGNVYGMSDLTERVAEELVPALSGVLDEHYRSAGVS